MAGQLSVGNLLSTLGTSQRIRYVALATGVLLVVRRLKKRAQEKRLPPGSRGNFLMGELIEYTADTHAFFADRFAKYGGTFLTNVFFKDTVVLQPSPANLKVITSQNMLGWPRHFLDVIGKTAIAMVNGAFHKKQRSLSGKAFNMKMLDSYLPAFQDLSQKHLHRWAADSQPKDMREDIKFYTFELAQRVLLGMELPEARSRKMMHLLGTTIEGLAALLPVNLPGFPYRSVLAARRELVAMYQEVIDEKRAANRDEMVAIPSAMIDYVMADDGKGGEIMSDVELQDFCVNMSFAGHDTTLASMQTLLHYLHSHPDVRAELRAEVDQLWDGSAPITRSLLQGASKCMAFAMEAMRLLPPVPFVARELASPVMVDGFELPAGMTVMCGVKSVMDYHLVKQGQGDDMDKLDIGRWFNKDGAFVGQSKLYEFASFSIFGAGGRMCIGYKFAMDELVVFLMTLLRGYDFTVTSTSKETFPFAFHRVTASFGKRDLNARDAKSA